LTSPPTASNASAMSRAVRVLVPLKSRCSRKCDDPLILGGSSRDPASTQKPSATERTPFMRSVTTRRPDSNSVRLMGMVPSLVGLLAPALAVPLAGASARASPVATPPLARSAVPVPALASWWLEDLHALGNGPLLTDRLEADLAHRVDLLDLVLEGVALLQSRLLDAGQAAAASELGDVHQTVSPRHQVDERPERRDLDDLAGEPLSDAQGAGVRDLVDHLRRLVGAGPLARADEHRAVVLDVDVGPGDRDDLVDPLALGADDLADLVDRDLDREDPRRLRVDLLPGGGDRPEHRVEDEQPGLPRLLQGLGERLGREPGDLHVE